MQLPPFEVLEPTRGETPIVVEVPHAGLQLDPETMASCVAPVEAIARDADLYVDELVQDALEEGATLVRAHMSRYVVDLNRDEHDYDPQAAQGGTARDRPFGVLWRKTTTGLPALAGAVPNEELARRLASYHRPYHAALDDVVRRKQRRFGRVIVLSMHSMPSTGRIPGRPSPTPRADVVIGSQKRTTAAEGLLAEVARQATSFGWTVAHDDPYAGGATTVRLGRPGQGQHAIQLELARRLYLDETTLRHLPQGVATVRSFCRALVAKLGAAALG